LGNAARAAGFLAAMFG
jgi:hypothetical protein